MIYRLLCLITALSLWGTLTHAQKRMDGGRAHSIFLCNNGQVYTMGNNSDGQLGTGNNTASNVPIAVNLGNVVSIAAGYDFCLAVLSDSTVFAWGDNQYGQLGIGTNIDQNTPTQIPGLTGVIAVEGGFFHGMALKADGTVWCWGRGTDGQLGNGSTSNSSLPVQATGLNNAVAISSSGYFSMALRADSTVWNFGSGNFGQMGNGATSSTNVPTLVPNLTQVVQMAASGYHSVVVRADSTVWSWGYNTEGQMGTGVTGNTTSPVQMLNITGAVEVAAGCHHSLIRLGNGTVFAVGRNTNGALGNGTTSNSLLPVQVSGLSNVCDIEAGCWSSMATQNNGSIFGWGRNTQGQLGLGNTTSPTTPLAIQSNCSVGCSQPLAAAITGNNLLCNSVCDGSATVNPTGGTPPYSYLWGPNANNQASATATNLCAGSYSVTVTDNGGDTQTLMISLSEPPPLTLSDSSVMVSCNGGNDGYLICVAAGGAGGFGFIWSNGATGSSISGLTPGNYCVTVTDANGCTDTICSTITQPSVLQTTADSLVNVSCNGANDGSVLISTTGGTPTYSYDWGSGNTGNSLSGLAPGSYCVTVADMNACPDTFCVTITEPNALAVVLNSTQASDVACDGSATVTPSGGTPPYTYLWNAAAGNQTTATADSICPGEACVTITDANGCVLDTCVTILTNIDAATENTLNIYPNPNQGQFRVEGIKPGDVLDIYDLRGKHILKRVSTSSNEEIRLGELSKGVYFLRVNNGKGYRILRH